jgi:hydroxymethylbilane synthase
MDNLIRIGTRESQLAMWQANQVKSLLEAAGYTTELVPVKSDGDIDLKTPLYEMGVQGIFTRSLDIALIDHRIDLAVHSMKDVPTRLPIGIRQAAVLERGAVSDLLVFKTDGEFLNDEEHEAVIATSSIRRKAQWLNRYPHHRLENLRGNVNTRLQKLNVSNWNGAIFAQAGLERIGVRPENSQVLDWMLPAPAQGAIMVVCRKEDNYVAEACSSFNHRDTEICTAIERSFLRTLEGGCSTPVSALATINNGMLNFSGSILSIDGQLKAEVSNQVWVEDAKDLGEEAANELLQNGGQEIAATIEHARG